VKKQQAIISLGSNLGNRLEQLQKALILIEKNGITVKTLSSLYETEAWGFKSPPFYNACAQIETTLEPEELLQFFIQVETQLGRLRGSSTQYSPRTIDIDLLFFDQRIAQTSTLTIPHPRLHLRNFVLEPLVEIAPQWRHPLLQKRATELRLQTPDQQKPKKLPFQSWSPPIFNSFPYIVIEGNIGVGKSTLAQKLATTFQSALLLERFAKNPFLEKFYANPKTYALAVEQFFLEDRISQLNEFWESHKGAVVSDYNIQKSLLFANQNLLASEFKVYKNRFDGFCQQLKLPDLMVYLHTDVDVLQAQIKKRGRPYEQGIEKNYLETIERGYQRLVQSDLPYPVLSVSTKELDFEKNEADFQAVLRLIYGVSF
jgi:deoxyguanosine kinase